MWPGRVEADSGEWRVEAGGWRLTVEAGESGGRGQWRLAVEAGDSGGRGERSSAEHRCREQMTDCAVSVWNSDVT